MKISIIRKNGDTYRIDDPVQAYELWEDYKKGKKMMIEIGGTVFSSTEVKEIIDLDHIARKQNAESCGKCKDGWVVTDKARPCNCSLGDRHDVYVREYQERISRLIA